MEWRKYYLDMLLVPLGFMIIIGYHVWLWHKVRTQPSSTIIGINTHGRRSWVPSMLKDIEKKNILAVQTLRNLIMGSTLMATTSILLSAGLAAVISSTYSVKKPLNDAIYGAHSEFMVFQPGIVLSTVGNRLFYSAFPLLLWIFGPVLVFLCSVAMIPVLYNLDFVCGNGKGNGVKINDKGGEDYV
ncbi:unnamed protein product [Lathyrus oleraceus]